MYASVAWDIKESFWLLVLIYDPMQVFYKMTGLLASVPNSGNSVLKLPPDNNFTAS